MNIKKTIFGVAFTGLIITSGIVAYSNLESTTTSIQSTSPTQWTTLKINDFEYSIDLFSNGNVLNVGTLNSDRYNTISIGEYSGFNITVNGTQLPSGSSIHLDLDSLSKSSQIEVLYTDISTGEERSLFINTLPENYKEPMVYSNDPDEGFYYFNLNEYIYKMDTEGNIVFWRLAGHGDASSGGNDFKPTVIDGQQYYTFLFGWETDESPYLEGVEYGRMQGLVLDQNYEIVDNVQFLNLNSGEKLPLENHQFTMLGKDHYLLTAYRGTYVENIPDEVPHGNVESRVVASIIKEKKNDQVIFEWDSTDYPELYGLSTAGNDFYNSESYWADYAHVNSVFIDADNNYICSFRNLDTILKIDRASGNILWKLGGIGDEFGLTEEQKFSKQHDVRRTADGYITIFNNGNSGDSPTEGNSSIIKLKLDESSKKVIDFQTFAVDGQFSSHMGSVQETANNHFVIGWGNRVTANALFSEIDFNTGKILFEVVSPTNSGIYPNAYKVYKSDK